MNLPLFRRECLSWFHPLWLVIGVLLTALLIQNDLQPYEAACLLTILPMIGCFWATRVMKTERDRGTLDLLALAPMSPHSVFLQIGTGIGLGLFGLGLGILVGHLAFGPSWTSGVNAGSSLKVIDLVARTFLATIVLANVGAIGGFPITKSARESFFGLLLGVPVIGAGAFAFFSGLLSPTSTVLGLFLGSITGALFWLLLYAGVARVPWVWPEAIGRDPGEKPPPRRTRSSTSTRSDKGASWSMRTPDRVHFLLWKELRTNLTMVLVTVVVGIGSAIVQVFVAGWSHGVIMFLSPLLVFFYVALGMGAADRSASDRQCGIWDDLYVIGVPDTHFYRFRVLGMMIQFGLVVATWILLPGLLTTPELFLSTIIPIYLGVMAVAFFTIAAGAVVGTFARGWVSGVIGFAVLVGLGWIYFGVGMLMNLSHSSPLESCVLVVIFGVLAFVVFDRIAAWRVSRSSQLRDG